MSTDLSRPAHSRPSPGRSEDVEGSRLPSDLSLVVSRGLGAVVVTVRGDLDDRGCELLGAMLADLIDGQGNLTVAVDLTCAAAGPPVAAMLTTAGSRARRLGARFIVKAPPCEIVEALASRESGELIEIVPRGGRR